MDRRGFLASIAGLMFAGRIAGDRPKVEWDFSVPIKLASGKTYPVDGYFEQVPRHVRELGRRSVFRWYRVRVHA